MTSKIIRTEDRDGRAIVRVELTNRPDVFVTVDHHLFDQWVAEGLPTSWYLNRNGSGTARVCFYDPAHRGQNAGVARRLLKLRPHTVVRYLDRDPLNLRSRNLQRARGWAKGATPSELSPVEPPSSAVSGSAAVVRDQSRIRVAAGGGVSQYQSSTAAILMDAVAVSEAAYG